MNIVLGVSSSIASGKVPDIVRLLKKNGHHVTVMMTKKASYMISPGILEELTGNRVYVALFEDAVSYEDIKKTAHIDHIDVAKKADLVAIVPATAHTIAKMAHGIADDFITTTVLATPAPVLVAPAMNTNMWLHPATQENIRTLRRYGYEIISPASGKLACGTTGLGRLPEPPEIVAAIEEIRARKTSLKGKTVLITAGGTEEPIDQVRTITNRSSGKMGTAIAEMCYRFGAQVIFLHARSCPTLPLPILQHKFSTAHDLLSLMKIHVKDADMVFHAAAVSDFTTTPLEGKIDSSQSLKLLLQPAHKLINDIKKFNPHVILIGFKAIALSPQTKRPQGAKTADPDSPCHSELVSETFCEISNSEREVDELVRSKSQKLFSDAHADFVVVNDVGRSDIGFGSDENEVWVIDSKGKITHIPKVSKVKVAEELLLRLINTGVLAIA